MKKQKPKVVVILDEVLAHPPVEVPTYIGGRLVDTPLGVSRGSVERRRTQLRDNMRRRTR